MQLRDLIHDFGGRGVCLYECSTLSCRLVFVCRVICCAAQIIFHEENQTDRVRSNDGCIFDFHFIEISKVD
jgi:hypothetical protein